MPTDITQLYRRLGYEFQDVKLLEAALSHRSAAGKNNERLEFLGDSVLNFIVTHELFRRYPRLREGELSRLRANLVKGETLAQLAQDVLDIGPSLRLGEGELKSGGFRRQSILADAVEAIIAAIYLDADLATCQRCVLMWLQGYLQQLSIVSTAKDAKTQLQEYLQSHHLELPSYSVVKIEGKAHEQVFWVDCYIAALDLHTKASEHSRRKAEQLAAAHMLSMIKEQKNDRK